MKKKIFIAGIFLSTFSGFNPVFIKSILLTSAFVTLPISIPLYASDRSDFYFNRAFNKSKKGDYDGAIKDYTKVIKINPKEANAFYNRGLAKRNINDFSGAIKDYTSSLNINPNDKEAYKKIREFSNKLIDKTLELKGTITGEHGVGLHKKSYLLKEHPDNIPLMKTIKRSVDPNNIMNPGKIFDLN